MVRLLFATLIIAFVSCASMAPASAGPDPCCGGGDGGGGGGGGSGGGGSGK
jgi:hypothetical protein